MEARSNSAFAVQKMLIDATLQV